MKKILFVVLIMVFMLALATTAFAKPAPKVNICHRTGNGGYRVINVSENAKDAHLAHGDAVVGDTVDENCEPLVAATCTFTDDFRDVTKTYEVPKEGFMADGTPYYSIDSDYPTTYTIAGFPGNWRQQKCYYGFCDLVGDWPYTTTCALP